MTAFRKSASSIQPYFIAISTVPYSTVLYSAKCTLYQGNVFWCRSLLVFFILKIHTSLSPKDEIETAYVVVDNWQFLWYLTACKFQKMFHLLKI
jgi:hypothetical protein